ncbi:MAG: hypothetical protein GXZ09_02800 [Syntrophomonadaceae bacterium]|jgi:anti-sigma factor RsiW|nr:hypothetical protein [Syntrophomonadaceae bacterium]
MQHFSAAEWERFLAGENPEQELMMENHLKACDQCRQVFLESIHAAELKRAQAVIKPDFTAQTLSLIRKSVAKKRPSSRRTNTRSLLLYYTAAAVLTLVLTGGGIIQNVNQKLVTLPQAAPSSKYSGYGNILWNWPAQLQEMTGSWLNNIDNINRRYSGE